MPIIQPVLTGRVFQRTDLGELPIAGASVVLGLQRRHWMGAQREDDDRRLRYLLCNVVDVGFGLNAVVLEARIHH